MNIKNIYCIELEDNDGRVFEKFNTYEEYSEYMADLVVEAYDCGDEVNDADLFNFKTWVVVFDTNGDLRSLTLEQFKAQA